MNRIFARGEMLPGSDQTILHLVVGVPGHGSQGQLRAVEVHFDGGDGAVHGGGDVAIEQLLAECEQIGFALLEGEGAQAADEGDVGGADLAAVGDECVLLGLGLMFVAAARDEDGEVIKPSLRLGGIAQALEVMHGVVDDEAHDAVADVFAATEAIGDAADAGVD